MAKVTIVLEKLIILTKKNAFLVSQIKMSAFFVVYFGNNVALV